MSRIALEAEPKSQPPPEDDHAFSGRPKGLLTLSGPEVWERFSFLGMQAILVLHFADTVTHGGTGMSSGTAASVSAAYGTLVFLLPVAGGRLADRILGSFRAALWGGPLIARGHSAMAVPTGTMMSATTKLAPAAFSSRTMSFWFPSRALANGIQAQTVKPYDDVSEPAYFAEATGVTP